MPEVEDLDDETLAPEVDDADLEQPVDEDDLPPDEDAGEPVDEPDEDQPAPRRSRASERIRALDTRAKNAEREAADLRAQVAASIRQPPPDPAADEAAFQARIADLPWDQQLNAVRDRERQLVGQALNGINMRIAQSDDRSAYMLLMGSDPLAKRHAAHVEAEAKKYAAAGQFVSRELILDNYLGKLARQRAPGAIRRAEARARDNLGRETGRASGARSDVAGRQRPDPNSLEAIESRLKDQFI